MYYAHKWQLLHQDKGCGRESVLQGRKATDLLARAVMPSEDTREPRSGADKALRFGDSLVLFMLFRSPATVSPHEPDPMSLLLRPPGCSKPSPVSAAPMTDSVRVSRGDRGPPLVSDGPHDAARAGSALANGDAVRLLRLLTTSRLLLVRRTLSMILVPLRGEVR